MRSQESQEEEEEEVNVRRRGRRIRKISDSKNSQDDNEMKTLAKPATTPSMGKKRTHDQITKKNLQKNEARSHQNREENSPEPPVKWSKVEELSDARTSQQSHQKKSLGSRRMIQPSAQRNDQVLAASSGSTLDLGQSSGVKSRPKTDETMSSL